MTPAILALDRLGITYELQTYDHDPNADSYGVEAVELLGLDPKSVFKTLLAEVAPKTLVVAVVPVGTKLDLKALAKAAGHKKAAMADPAEAEKVTGYVVGGISPLGQKKRLPTFIDSSATALDLINVSGGKRGLEIRIAPNDLATASNATFAKVGV